MRTTTQWRVLLFYKNINEKNMNIAILSSFTARPIEAALREACKEADISCGIYLGGYNQYAQEILNPQSGLYSHTPDMVIFFVDTRALLGDLFFVPYDMSDEVRKDFIEEKCNELITLVGHIKQNSSAKILFHSTHYFGPRC